MIKTDSPCLVIEWSTSRMLRETGWRSAPILWIDKFSATFHARAATNSVTAVIIVFQMWFRQQKQESLVMSGLTCSGFQQVYWPRRRDPTLRNSSMEPTTRRLETQIHWCFCSLWGSLEFVTIKCLLCLRLTRFLL